MTEKSCYLYHAIWCHFCRDFLPEWTDVLIPEFEKRGIKSYTFEEQEIKDDDEIFKLVKGWPSIIIKIGENDPYLYEGPREKDLILAEFETESGDSYISRLQRQLSESEEAGYQKINSITEKSTNLITNLEGGALNNTNFYLEKYKKYKVKYLKLINKNF